VTKEEKEIFSSFVRFGFPLRSDEQLCLYKINGGDLTPSTALVEILQSLITFPLGARRSTIASIKDL